MLSSSKSINNDNSLLNCRISGLTHKSPDLIILDRNLIIKKSLKIFKDKTKRRIYLYTTKDNKSKISWLRKKKVKVLLMKRIDTKNDFFKLFKSFVKLGLSRIFVESGLTLINFLIKNDFINNIYIFKTNYNLNKNGSNNSSNKMLKKIKLKNKLNVFLNNDSAYLERLN